jgi:hypothetical protein
MKGTVIEVVKRDDGAFDLFSNLKLHHGQIQETYLQEWLCVRFGFCGEEYRSILKEVNLRGRWAITL